MVRLLNKTIDASHQSREIVTIANSEVKSGDSRNMGPRKSTMEPDADYEETTRQGDKTRISTSTKVPGTRS